MEVEEKHEIDDWLVDVAQRTYAVTRGSERGRLPEHLALAWDDLGDDVRRLYVQLVVAGYSAHGNL